MEIVQRQRASLAASALERLPERSRWSDADLAHLLTLCTVEVGPPLLAAIEEEGRQLALDNEQLDLRLESIERSADALGAALDAMMADEDLRQAARTALWQARRACITALGRGFQRALEQASHTERDRSRHALDRLRAVQRINAVANSTLSFEEALDTAAQVIAEAVGIELCAIFMYDSIANELNLLSTNRSPNEIAGHFTIHLGEQVTGQIAAQSTPAGVYDVRELPEPPVEATMFDRPYRGIFVVPIIFFGGTGTTLEGTITLLTEQPRHFTDEEKAFLELIAGQLAMSIENSQIYRRAEEHRLRQIANINMLQHISATVATSFDLSRVLQMIVTQAVQMSGASHGAIFQLEGTGKLRMAAHHHLDAPGLRDMHLNLGECCVGRAAEQGDRVWGIDCMHTNPTCYLRHARDLVGDTHSSLAAPLLSKGQIQGVLHLLSPSRHMQPSIQAKMVETFANEAAVAIESTNLYEETRDALEMKSHLLQEMHHRVKNNMLSIAAILRMERRRTTAPEAVRVLSESISRIDGMAATHDLLSRDERIGTAAIGDIATKLIGVVSAHLVPPTLRVQFDQRARNVEVHSKKALILALVLNELLANAIEHGLADREFGCIRIGAWEEDEQVHIVIADDGQGPPSEIDMTHLSSLGLSLVRDMTRDQLHGYFVLRRGPLPPDLRDDPQNETPWTLAEIVFTPERELLPPSQRHD